MRLNVKAYIHGVMCHVKRVELMRLNMNLRTGGELISANCGLYVVELNLKFLY